MKRKGIFCFLMLFFMTAVLIPFPARAEEKANPKAVDDLVSELRGKSYLVSTDKGYMRVVYDASGAQVVAEEYNDRFQIQSSRKIPMELPVWGGFFAGSDAYYLVEGQNNPEEQNDKEVIRVIRYSKSWERLGAAAITGNLELFGGEVGYPFHYGNVNFAEQEGKLYIATAHRGYVDEAVGQGHQGLLLIEVDTGAMTGRIVVSNLWHSFAQHLAVKGDMLYLLEQSEGSYQTQLTVLDRNTYQREIITLLRYGGQRTSAWAVACYASVDDIALSATHALSVGTSIDQSLYDSVDSKVAHNIYLAATPLSGTTEEAGDLKWITDFQGDGKQFVGLNLTKIDENRFILMWEEAPGEDFELLPQDERDPLSGYTMHYLFLDGQGNPISQEYTAAAPVSGCHPVLKDSWVVFSASSGNTVNFYSIDGHSGAFYKAVNRVAGAHAAWDIKEGVLEISGSGPIEIDTEAHYRYPLSSTGGGYSYSNADNAWKMIRDKVKKIVIGDGITAVPEACFRWFDALEEVDIGAGIQSLGKETFAYSNKLRTVTLRPFDVEIGEDAFWSGYYPSYTDDTHLVFATIYCMEGGTVDAYVQEHSIEHVYLHWMQENGKWVYYDKGQKVKGWIQDEGQLYYTSKNGYRQSGWLKLDGLWNYFKADGTLYHGWPKLDGAFHYVTGGVLKENTTALVKSSSKDPRQLYVKNGIWQKSFTGFYDSPGGKTYYIKEGVLAGGANGLIKRSTDSKWLYVKNGIWQKSFTGFYDSPNGKNYYINNGIVGGTALVKRESDGKWVYVQGGIWQKDFTGFYDSPNGKSYYIKEGLLASGANGLIKRSADDKWLYVKNGIWQKSFTGFYDSPNGKTYYIRNGLVGGTTLVKRASDGKWVYVKSGIWQKDFTGFYDSPNGKSYYINKGILAGTLLVKRASDGKWVYLKGGIWQKDFTGFYTSSSNGKTFYVSKGVWASGATGLYKRSSDGKWLYVKSGYFQKDFTGIYQSPKGEKFYVLKGIWQSGFTGTKTFDGVRYNIKAGKVQ